MLNYNIFKKTYFKDPVIFRLDQIPSLGRTLTKGVKTISNLSNSKATNKTFKVNKSNKYN